MLITMQELASGKGKHPVSSFIFACSYLGTFVFLSLSLSSTLPLFTLSFSFMLHTFFLFLPSLQLQGFWPSVII